MNLEKSSLKVLCISVLTTTIAGLGPLTLNHTTLAQVPGNQVAGGGNGVMTCLNGSTVNVGSSFNAANDQNGKFMSGGFLFQTLKLPILQKTGSFFQAIITPIGFVLIGNETSDAICKTSPEPFAVIIGPCDTAKNQGPFRTNFVATNGEKANITSNTKCIITVRQTQTSH
jgi:hypothetical protein